VLGHFKDGVHGFFLSGFDEAASIDDQNFGLVGARSKFVAAARENAHHDLGVDEVLGASEAHESYFSHRWKICRFAACFRLNSVTRGVRCGLNWVDDTKFPDATTASGGYEKKASRASSMRRLQLGTLKGF